MRYGKIICDPNSEEAKALIEKKVLASDSYVGLQKVDSKLCDEGILDRIDEDDNYPFHFGVDFCKTYTFIREVIEPQKKYVPYDLSKQDVRDKLRGKWYRKKDDDVKNESTVTHFFWGEIVGWKINGFSPSNFLKTCEWLDGTPCGEEVSE